MANSLTWPVFKIDTSMTLTMDYRPHIFVNKLVFRPAAAGNTVTVSDGKSVETWKATSLAAWPIDEPKEDFGSEGRKMNGFVVVITGGELYVYLKE